MSKKYNEKAIFLAVYITEAHSSDEWPCGKTLSFCEQPKTTERRCQLAKLANQKTNYSFPFLVDTIQNQFENSYAAWPFRFYGLVDGKLSFKAQPELSPHFAYDVNKLEDWIKLHI